MISQETARHSFLVLSSNVLKLGFGFITTMILASGLGPVGFGQYSQVINLVLTVSALADFGINLTFVRLYGKRSDDPQDARIFWSRGIFTIRILLSAVVTLFSLLLLPAISMYVTSDEIRSTLVRLACLMIVGDGIFSFVLAVCQAGQKFKKYAILNPLPNIVRTVILGLMYLTQSMNVDTAVLAIIAAVTTGSLVSIVIDPALRLRRIRRDDLDNFRGMLGWGKWLLIQTIANTFMVKLDLIMLGYFDISNDLIGNYALGLYFASLITILQTTFITVLLPRVSALKSGQEVGRYMRRTFGMIMAIVSVVVCVGFGGSYAIRLFYGAEYPYASSIFGYLIIAFGASFIVTPITILAFTFDFPQILAFQNIAAAVLVFGIQVLLIPLWGILGAAIAVVLARTISEGAAMIAVYARVNRDRDVMVHP